MREFLGSVWRIAVILDSVRRRHWTCVKRKSIYASFRRKMRKMHDPGPIMAGLTIAVVLTRLRGQSGPQLNPYTQIGNTPPMAILFYYWSVGADPLPPCGQQLPSKTPGPSLGARAIVKGTAGVSGDTEYVCLTGVSGALEWVKAETAP